MKHMYDVEMQFYEFSAKQRREKILYARKLRLRMTLAERVLWFQLRAHKLCGLKFRRQAPVGRFIADFLCVEKRLIVELDGSIHAMQTQYDDERDTEIEKIGYRVLRVPNEIVMQNLTTTINEIKRIAFSPLPAGRMERRERGGGEGKL